MVEALPKVGSLSYSGLVANREFDRLYDPRHPVRNNLETLDSVEVIRTIREVLKR
ncbi:MAG: hypothetical protein KAT62_15565 [Desulfuromonadales bacterium]|nr:hypothetical protein [Desulfuromonadales bacterium]